MRAALVGAGLAEAVTYSFTDPRARWRCSAAARTSRRVELLNPLSEEASLLRQHPLEGLLGAVATNLRRRQPNVRRLRDRAGTYAARRGRHERAALGRDRADGRARGRRVVPRRRAAWTSTTRRGSPSTCSACSACACAARRGAGSAGFEPDSHGVLVTGGRRRGRASSARSRRRCAPRSASTRPCSRPRSISTRSPRVTAPAVALRAAAALPGGAARHGVRRSAPTSDDRGGRRRARARAEAGPLLRDVDALRRLPVSRRPPQPRLAAHVPGGGSHADGRGGQRHPRAGGGAITGDSGSAANG